MKILCIGNSFSEDATAYLQSLNSQDELFVRNLFVPGCSLDQHYNFSLNKEACYDFQKDGIKDTTYSPEAKIDLVSALKLYEWDVVTLQQASYKSGKAETYSPYISALIDIIKANAPTAKIYFHRTWCYEYDCKMPQFAEYDNEPDKMFSAIKAASDAVCAQYELPIIACGDFIQKLRKTKTFDVKNGGISIYQDGMHLSRSYGRFAAALYWYCFFTKSAADKVTFKPEGANESIINLIKNTL